MARVTSRDVELHGQVVPEGSIVQMIPAAANHDDRRFPDGDRFDIHRKDGAPLTFGFGIHLCLGCGAGPARGPGRPRRGPEPVPHLGRRHGRAHLAPTSTVRGWETLPVTT